MAAAFGSSLFWKGTTYSMAWFALFGVGCLLMLFTGKHKLDNGAMPYLVLAWFLFVLSSVFIINNDGVSKALWPSLGVVPLYYFSTMREDRGELLKYHLMALFGVLVVLGLYSIYEWIETSEYASGPFINSNNLAAVLNIGLIVSVGLYFKERAWGFGVVLFGLALLATGSRGGMISAAIAASVLLFRVDRRFIIPVFLCLLIALLTVDKESFDTLSARIVVWKVSLAMAMEHPIGLGLFYREFPIYALQNYPELAPTFAKRARIFFVHNDPLQFWVEMGIIAPILFYSICVQGVVDFIKNPKVTIPFCTLLVVILHTHISFHLYVPSVGILLGLVLSYYGLQANSLVSKLPQKR
jgi:O-antigen ligase